MKESQKQVRDAVLIMGKALDIEKITELLLSNVGMQTTIKELMYKAFLKNWHDYFEKDDKVFYATQLVREYCNEYEREGEVKFDVPFDNDLYIKTQKETLGIAHK
jgi:hypothetical protein